jgi:predicted RNA binding protein YcfA (HicA-like mRNA interferase family)
MPKMPGVNHLDAVRALQKAGFWILRQGKHIVMTDGTKKVVIPRHNPVNAITMGGIVQDAGLTDYRRVSQTPVDASPNQTLHLTGGARAWRRVPLLACPAGSLRQRRCITVGDWSSTAPCSPICRGSAGRPGDFPPTFETLTHFATASRDFRGNLLDLPRLTGFNRPWEEWLVLSVGV